MKDSAPVTSSQCLHSNSGFIIMSSQELINTDVQNAIKELRERVKNVTPSGMYEDTNMFYRFLKARDFHVDKAEVMLRKHLTWRKAFQVDTILETFHPKEAIVKYILPSIIGYNKEGNLIGYSPMGKMDAKNIKKCVKMNDYMKHFIYFGEQMVHLIKEHNEQTGKNNYQGILIMDLDALTFANATDKDAAEDLIQIFQILQDHYPERTKAIYAINAPIFYVIVYSILKRFLSPATQQKILVFGQNGWKEALLKIVDADVLPAFLGGTRTDPDGDPLCSSFIKHSGKFPSTYFITDEERWFKDRSQVKKLVIEPSSKEKVFIEVKECDSSIQWAFEVKNKDIGFGLFYQKGDDEVEILPIRKLSTSDGTETDSYRAKFTGTYIIIFDNSHSWLNSKEVNYTVTVVQATS